MVRPLTQQLFDSIMGDVFPGMACRVDFGLNRANAQQCYEALYYPVRNREITLQQLEEALGSGPKLTALVNAARSNPHKGIVFKTAWDDMGPEDPEEV